MDKVVAKFRIDETAQHSFNRNTRRIKASAVYGNTPENASFAEATPSGTVEITVSNPAVLKSNFFELGEEYYVTFEKANKG